MGDRSPRYDFAGRLKFQRAESPGFVRLHLKERCVARTWVRGGVEVLRGRTTALSAPLLIVWVASRGGLWKEYFPPSRLRRMGTRAVGAREIRRPSPAAQDDNKKLGWGRRSFGAVTLLLSAKGGAPEYLCGTTTLPRSASLRIRRTGGEGERLPALGEFC